jgi:formate dehydrogenase major subunit/formate dehydrogenase alpha subunit
VRPAISPRGESRSDWQITRDLAQRILQLQGHRPVGPDAGWDYTAASDILTEAARLTPQYAGISHSRLQAGAQLQWPVPDATHPGTPILHVGRFTAGLGKFHAVDDLPPHEQPDDEYPFLLTTGRVLYHWHGGEMTRRARGLLEIYPASLVEVSPEDAARLSIADGDTIRLTSRRGEMQAVAAVTDRIAAGVVFGNFHFPGIANVNNLTIAALDPTAKIPEYKVCAIRIERIGDA